MTKPKKNSLENSFVENAIEQQNLFRRFWIPSAELSDCEARIRFNSPRLVPYYRGERQRRGFSYRLKRYTRMWRESAIQHEYFFVDVKRRYNFLSAKWGQWIVSGLHVKKNFAYGKIAWSIRFSKPTKRQQMLRIFWKNEESQQGMSEQPRLVSALFDQKISKTSENTSEKNWTNLLHNRGLNDTKKRSLI